MFNFFNLLQLHHPALALSWIAPLIAIANYHDHAILKALTH